MPQLRATEWTKTADTSFVMSLISNAQSLYSKLLSWSNRPVDMELSAACPLMDEADAFGTDQTVSAAPASSDPAVTDEAEAGSDSIAEQDAEFGDLLNELGAEPIEDLEESVLSMKDATIAALEQRLRDLRGLGDELARTERVRLAAFGRICELEDLVEELEGEVAAAVPACDSNRSKVDEAYGSDEAAADMLESRDDEALFAAEELIVELETSLQRMSAKSEKREALHCRTLQRLAKSRVKCAERHATAATRWRLIQDLRREKKQLETELREANANGAADASDAQDSRDAA
ncbi:MAG: hypothetical protein ACI835_001128 [Planctomycetota bacterium]